MGLFYLIRHAEVDGIGRRLAGRSPEVHLNRLGQQQIETLSCGLAKHPIQRVISSPIERCRETANRIAEAIGLAVETSDALIELDFGDWTGRSFEELERDPQWIRYNKFRSAVQIPRGESFLDVQRRIIGFMRQLLDQDMETVCALVSHGDVIRAALLYWLGIPVDYVHRLRVEPASVSMIRVGNDDAELLLFNGGPARSG